jgi:imidazole glycerol-phosphate synthase subunit HisF
MMFERLIGVITVRDGRAVKSYGYARWQPAGGIRSALLNLDRWGVDEIVLVDVSRRHGIDPRVLAEVDRTRLTTPLTYGGGIRTLDDVRAVLAVGVDRILTESLMWSNPAEITRIAEVIGGQAIVASLPVQVLEDGEIAVWSPTDPGLGAGVPSGPDRPRSVASWVDHIGSLPCEEVLVTDVRAEGHRGGFSAELPDLIGPGLQRVGRPIIWFGGIDHASARSLLAREGTTGIAVGNILHEEELAIARLRAAVSRSDAVRVRPVGFRHG